MNRLKRKKSVKIGSNKKKYQKVKTNVKIVRIVRKDEIPV